MARSLTVAGACLVSGGLLWQPMLAVEHLQGLQHRSTRQLWYANQQGFLVAMVLLTVGVLALGRARVAGDGLMGRWAVRGLALGWLMLVLAQGAWVWFTWRHADALTGIGGLLTYLTELITGVATLRAGRLTGWRRWPLVLLAAYQGLVILLPLMLGATGPTWPAEAGWQLCWVVVGVSALQQAAIRNAARGSAQDRMSVQVVQG